MISEGPHILSAQLRQARELVQLPPDEVASRLGTQPDEIFDWETGRKKPGLQQLERLAELYGREIDYFLKETPGPPTKLQFRSTTTPAFQFQDLSHEARIAIAKFDEWCRSAYELEGILGKVHVSEIEHVPSNKPPIDLAREQRESLGLAERPASRLRDRLTKRGVRILELPIPQGQFSGFSYWHLDYGPCILVNAKEVPGRKNFTLAHEYAHRLYDHPPLVCDVSEGRVPSFAGDERSADVFAVEFLLPRKSVYEDFLKRELSKTPSIQDMGRMAGGWYVSIQAMGYRLEGLNLIEHGYTDKLLASYKPQIRRKGPPKAPRWERRLGRAFVSNTLEAYYKGHISLEKLAYYLGIPLRKALEVSERSVTKGEHE
jgi:Zn-dependent peptidase ImmA (M78 family)